MGNSHSGPSYSEIIEQIDSRRLELRIKVDPRNFLPEIRSYIKAVRQEQSKLSNLKKTLCENPRE